MPRKGRWVDLSLVGLAVLLRAAAVLVLQSHTVPRSTYEHGEIAANLVAGRGFSLHFLGADGPTSQQAPVYPLLLAGAYLALGAGTPAAHLLLELGQSIAGGLLVVGVLRLAREVAPARAWLAWAAGMLVAIHPTLVYAATHVQAALCATTILVWTLVWAYKTGTTGLRRHALVAGTLLAILALTDPILTLCAPGIGWAIQLGRAGRAHPRRSSVRLTILVLVAALAGVSPWLVRNAQIHGEFVPIKSTFGYAFWQGNCALSEGTDKVRRQSTERILEHTQGARSLEELNRGLWEARHEAGYLDDIALTLDDRRWLGAFSEPERSRILFCRALFELITDPSRYGRLCLRRLRYFVFFDETNPKTRVLAYRAPHLALTLLALAGVLLAGHDLRRRLAPTFLTAFAITLFHMLTIASARFHIPLEPLLALWGAAAVSRCFDRTLPSPSSAPPKTVAFRSAKGRSPAERKATIPQG
jgi:hypothetical protein